MSDVIFAFFAGCIIGASITLVLIIEYHRWAWRRYLPELTDLDIKFINEAHQRRKKAKE